MSMQFDQVQLVTITEDNQHQRVDNYLIRVLKGVPKSKIYRILRKGEVRVNKKRVKPDYKLQASDMLRIPPIRISDNKTPDLSSHSFEFLEEAIIFEDERLIVVNKPSGMAVHGGSGLHFGLIEALRALRPKQEFLELVHRLDRDTSGCIVLAKRRSALRHLHAQLRDKAVDKTYHAVVNGNWPSKIKSVKASLYKNQLQSGERLVFVDERGKESDTRFKVIERYVGASLIEARPITGRTHQIRVHCQYAGHSIANDSKYGHEEFSKYIQGLNCKRLCLHAKSIRFIHPLSEKVISFNAPYDKSMSQLLGRLPKQREQHQQQIIE